MDIRNWPLDRIMQLPDHCFGRRWPIIFSDRPIPAQSIYYISEAALPEKCVIWELFASVIAVGGTDMDSPDVRFSYKLGDQLPTVASWLEMEQLFNGVDMIHLGSRSVLPFTGVLPLRQPVAASGRRICLRVYNVGLIQLGFCTGVVISSIPREVPDWLNSGHLRSR